MATSLRIEAAGPASSSPASSTLAGWTAGVTTAVVLVLLLPFFLARDPVGTVGRLPGLLCFVVITLAGVRLGLLIVAGRPRYMAFCFWTFVYVWFGLSAFLQLDADLFPRRLLYIGTTYSSSLLSRAELVVLVGCIAYEIGYRVRPRAARLRSEVPAEVYSRLPLVVACWVAVLLSAYYLASVGPALITSRTELGTSGIGADKQIKTTLFAIGALAAWCIGPRGPLRWATFRRPERYLFALVVGLTLVVCNPLTTQRGLAGAAYGAVLLAFVPKTSRSAVRVVALVILAGTIFVFPALDLFRGADSSRYETVIETGDVFAPLRETSGNYAMYTEVADGVDYVDKNGHTNGRHMLATAFVFVPRSVWPGKAEDLANSVTRQLGYPEYFNFASPLWEEFYVEGGFGFVLVGFVIYGLLSRRLDAAMDDTAPSPYLAAITPALASFQLYLLRGPLLTTGALAGLLIVVSWLAFPRSRQQAGNDAPAVASDDGALRTPPSAVVVDR